MRPLIGCLAWPIAICVIVGVVFKFLLFDVATIGHNGMAPTVISGEKVLIWRHGDREIGAISVCSHPRGGGLVMGRIVGTGGNVIDVRNGVLRIDGETIETARHGATQFFDADIQEAERLEWGTEYLGDYPHRYFTRPRSRLRLRRTTVAAGQVYLLNDYRTSRAQDSREYGTVDATTCIGNVVMRLTPGEGMTSEWERGYFDLVNLKE